MKYAREMTFGSESSVKGTSLVYVPDTPWHVLTDYIKKRRTFTKCVCACARVCVCLCVRTSNMI